MVFQAHGGHSYSLPLMGRGKELHVNRCGMGALFLLLSSGAWGQEPEDHPLDVRGKAGFHWRQTASMGFVVETAAYAGVLHWMRTPQEWGQNAPAYGKRVASAAGATGIRNLFAFALDSTLGEDPRYRRSGRGNPAARIGYAVRETLLTRSDSGRTRPASWRWGSAVGAACLSNVWYPDRLNTFGSGMEQAGATIGLDLLGNIASEFWPDIRRLFHR